MLKKTLGLALAGVMLGAFSANAADYYGTLQKIKESGTIVLAHRESSVPFSYVGPDRSRSLFEVCAPRSRGDQAELKLDNLAVKYVPVTPQTRIPLIANGNINMECGSTTNNLTRQQQVDFAYTTYITGTKLLVKKSSGIKEVEDLKGKSIALAQGTTNERAIKETVAKLNIPDVKILNVKDHAEGFLALETDRVDAYSTDHILLFGLIAKAKNPADYAVVGRFLSFDPYALMLPRDDSAFRLVVNKTLAGLFRSGEIEKLYDKWFVQPIPGSQPVNVPLDDTLKTNFMVQAFPE